MYLSFSLQCCPSCRASCESTANDDAGKHRGRGSLEAIVMVKLQKNQCQQATRRIHWRKGGKGIFFSHLLFNKFEFTSYRPNSVF